jgi:diaminopimelate decarboxylase
MFGALLERYGSPLYVYQLDRVDAALADLRAALPSPSTVYYSVKANPHPELVRALHTAGCRIEVSSAGEVTTTVAAGVPAAHCLYTGPAKTAAEIELALRHGVRSFSVESTVDLERVSQGAVAAGVIARCLVRVNTPAAGATALRMTGVASQFGTGLATLLAGRPWGAPGVEIAGAHFFPLSNARDEESLLAEFHGSIAAAARLRDTGWPLSVVDLGGGFAAPYAMPGERPVYASLRPKLESTLDELLPGWRSGDPAVAFESGRYLVGDCGTLVCTAMERKGDFLVLDSGINHLGGIGGLGRILRPAATPNPADPDGTRSTIAGPLCTPADIVGRDVVIGHVNPGDPVVFPNVGAYGLTASLLGFLSRPAPAEVVLRGSTVISTTRLELIRDDMS